MVSPSVSSCEEVPVCPTVPVRNPGRLATCQVVQVDGLVLTTLGPLIMVAVLRGDLLPTTGNSDLPKSRSDCTEEQPGQQGMFQSFNMHRSPYILMPEGRGFTATFGKSERESRVTCTVFPYPTSSHTVFSRRG